MIRMTFACLMLVLLCSCKTSPPLTLSDWNAPAGKKARTSDRASKLEMSPHADAIRVVLETQGKMIRKVDKQNWWHDAKKRQWVVHRPFHPGTIDSTHMFIVSYEIDGKSVATWAVDTKKRTALPSEASE